jgi:hypothetical protein
MADPPRPPIPPLKAKVEFQGTIFGHQWRNIAYLSVAGTGIGTADLNTLAGSIDSAWGTRLITVLSNDTTLTGVRVTYIPSVDNEIVGISTTARVCTGGASTVLDASASFVVNWQVNKYYRGGHPRWYLPGVKTGDITNGSAITSAARTGVASACNSLLNDINALTTTNITSVTLGTLSFRHDKAWRDPPVSWAFTGSSVAPYLGTQRRRIRS